MRARSETAARHPACGLGSSSSLVALCSKPNLSTANQKKLDIEPWPKSAEKMVVGFVTLVRRSSERSVRPSAGGRKIFQKKDLAGKDTERYYGGKDAWMAGKKIRRARSMAGGKNNIRRPGARKIRREAS